MMVAIVVLSFWFYFPLSVSDLGKESVSPSPCLERVGGSEEYMHAYN
jgi:hypothetical protein